MTENRWFEVCDTFLKTIDAGKSCWFACDGRMCASCPYLQSSIGCDTELTTEQWKYEFKQWLTNHSTPRISVKITLQQLCELESHDPSAVISDIVNQAASKREILRRANEIRNDDTITIDNAYGLDE